MYVCGLQLIIMLFAASLYLAPSAGRPAIAKLQQSLRVTVHMAAELLGIMVLIVCSQTPQSVICSPFWPEYNAIEALCAHMLWPAAYSLLAAIPLSMAIPFQTVMLGLYMSHNWKMCVNGYIACPKTNVQYQMLQGFIDQIGSSILPFAAPSKMPIADKANCLSVLAGLEVINALISKMYS